MERQTKRIREKVETIVKPVGDLIEKFNSFMKKLEGKTFHKEGVVEVDGFVKNLIEEVKDAEQGILGFFAEILFMQHLSERMAEVENEITLVEILGERAKDLLKPDFINIFLQRENGTFSLVYSYPEEKSDEGLLKIIEKSFATGESFIYTNKKLKDGLFSLLVVPLRTTKEKFGSIVIGRKGKRNFKSEEITLLIAGCSVVSFTISNVKLMQKIIRDEKLVTIGETIASLSHDIKNLLTTLENGIFLLDAGIEDKDFKTLTKAKEILKRSYEKMKNLVLSMIDYTKEREVEFTFTDLNSLIEDTVNSYKETFKEKKIKVILKLDKNLPEVSIDPYRFDRLLSNLIQNSIDAVEEGKGIIEIGTLYMKEKSQFLLWIEDNGCGISEKNINRIFDIFYSTKGSRGTGFGLAIVKKIVQEHNGSIEVNSEPGKGTKFLLRFPAKTTLK
ncbi:GHKL domain-containing protein [bacterium]|nr:GHKL domain-containing protein [bacterium]